jgi:hypothetical protein
VSEILINFREPALNSLYQSLNHPESGVRKFAVDIIGEIGKPESYEKILTCIEDPDENVQFSVIEAFGKIKNPLSVPLLKRLALEKPEMMNVIIESAGELKARELLPVVENGINNPDPVVCFTAIESLGKMGTKDQLPLLTEVLEEEGEFYIEETILSLLKICYRENVPVPVKLYSDRYFRFMNSLIEKGTRVISEYIRDNVQAITEHLSPDSWVELFTMLDEGLQSLLVDNLILLPHSEGCIRIEKAFHLSKREKKGFILHYARSFFSPSLLKSALQDPDEWIVFQSMEIVSPKQLIGLLPAVIAMLESDNEILQNVGKMALKKLQIEEIEGFYNLLHSHSLSISQEAEKVIQEYIDEQR